MKVLLLNCVYKQGSTGKIISSLHDGLLHKGYDSYVFYGTGKEVHEEYAMRICGRLEHCLNALLSRITGIPFGGVFVSNRRIKTFIMEERPDIVHIHCINGSMVNIYDLLSFLGHNGNKTVVTLHAEFFHTGSCSHAFECQQWMTGCNKCSAYKEFLPSFFFDKARIAWLKMSKAFSSFNKKNLIITSVSPWLMKRAKCSSILGSFTNVYVPNGVNVDVFKRISVSKHLNPCILFVSPHFEPNNPQDQKGGKYLLEIAKLCSSFNFIIVSSKSSYKPEQIPSNIRFIGKICDQTVLAEIYNNSDVTLVLSKRETYSMVTAESLCCGTPVVGFKAGGPESIAINDFSEFVNYGDVGGVINAIKRMIKCDYDHQEIARIAAAQYSFNKVTESYITEYKKLING